MMIRCTYLYTVKSKNSKQSYEFTKTNIENDFVGINNMAAVLSIDLDYFSSDDISGEKVQIEISIDEYERFLRDKNHILRRTYGGRVSFRKENERVYLLIREYIQNQNTVNTKEIIDGKIQKLYTFFTNSNIKLKEIIICKSVISGYVSEKQANYLIQRLANLERFKIND